MNKITPEDIYNFYLTSYYIDRLKKPIKNKPNIVNFLKDLKQSYITNLKPIIVNQILKYIKRGRIDDDLTKVSKSDSLEVLLDKMKKTYRSDMSRRNTEWENIIEAVLNLSKSSNSIKKLIYYLDRVNNTIHNTGESVLSKLGYNLLSAFDKAHEGTLDTLQNNADFDTISQWFENVDKSKKASYMRDRWGVYESTFDKLYNKIINEVK